MTTGTADVTGPDASPDSAGDRRYDVAVVGLGPAGRAFAHHCTALGLRVLAVDPAPDAVWAPTYGVWADEIAHLPDAVVRTRIERPVLATASGARPLPRTYALLDNTALQRHLHLDGAQVRVARLEDTQVSALRREAEVVVDARGARPAGGGGRSETAAAQTAYGIVLPEAAARPALDGHPALLMDWRTDWAERPGEATRATPTFLYAIDLGDGTVLLEETALAASPPLAQGELERRLVTRLTRRGVDPAAIAAPVATERVVIPLRGRGAPPPAGCVALGVAGRGGNAVTGYSVAHALRTAPDKAAAVARGEGLPSDAPSRATEVFRAAGLRALLRLRPAGTFDLFDAFGRLPGESQQAFFDRGADAGPLLASMWRMFVALPGPAKVDLVRATVGPGSERRRRRR